ncbi:hypothetical protein H0I39_19735 [Ottowia beijingensis]|uniref:Tripartite tricarboxylate transporter family receptor n=1 Tax=Ottowia beijingensis TaxID=1207057 RepID=A0A853IZP9_9BURK|nr:tripartite tricarboxylate transporter substrate-binding protein [Ottowia beijingensis]NZA03385.1 hypothetical protein [Ottowia beijingensis]
MTHLTMTRRHALTSIGMLAAGTIPTLAHAEPPVGMATIVVGLAAGGATDAAARRLAEGIRGNYAKTVVVENRTGAGARLAIQHVKAAAPNGSTLLLTPASMMAIYPHTYKDLAYDPVKDLVSVALVSTSELGYGVGSAVPESVKPWRITRHGSRLRRLLQHSGTAPPDLDHTSSENCWADCRA